MGFVVGVPVGTGVGCVVIDETPNKATPPKLPSYPYSLAYIPKYRRRVEDEELITSAV